jgi:hypothetical protein
LTATTKNTIFADTLYLTNMKEIISFILLIFLSAASFSQGAFIQMNDSVTYYGVELDEGNDHTNANVCILKKNNRLVKYGPERIKGYKTASGREYVSKEVDFIGFKKNYFLEKLVSGDITLYGLKLKRSRVFFIKTPNGPLTKIPQKDLRTGKTVYRDSLLKFCKDSIAIKRLEYKKPAFIELIERENRGIIGKPFPFLKFGIFGGYSLTNMNINNDFFNNQIKIGNDKNFTAGIFLDVPFYSSFWSFHPELFFTQNAFSVSSEYQNVRTGLLSSYSSLNTPFLFRYTFGGETLRPFINAGPSFSLLFVNKEHVYRATETDSAVNIETLDKKILPNIHMGYSLGAGIQVNLDYRRSLYLEVRYNNEYGFVLQQSTNKSMIQLSTGINY